VTLDKYVIFEKGRRRTVYNWLQYFNPDVLNKEFARAGFRIEALYSDVAGAPFSTEADEFAIVARRI